MIKYRKFWYVKTSNFILFNSCFFTENHNKYRVFKRFSSLGMFEISKEKKALKWKSDYCNFSGKFSI